MEQLYGPNPRSLSSYPPVASCHPYTVFVFSYLPQIHPLQTPAHAYVDEHTYKLCPAAVAASSGGCWRGEWNKSNAAGEHLCKELVLSAAPPFCYDAHLLVC